MFKKLFIVLTLIPFIAACTQKKVETNIVDEGIKKSENFGIHLAIQSDVFHNLPLDEVFDKTQELGLKYIEVTLGHNWHNKSFSTLLSVDEQTEIAESARQRGVSIIGINVNNTIEEEENWEHVFTLAQSLKVEYIVCSPPPTDELETIVKLAEHTNIKVAIRNDSSYLHLTPEKMLDIIAKYPSTLVGICADVAIWQSQNIDYIDALTAFEGRIITTRIRDISPKKEDPFCTDTAWGFGSMDIDALVIKLKEQGYKGYLPINIGTPTNREDAIKECISYYGIIGNYIF